MIKNVKPIPDHLILFRYEKYNPNPILNTSLPIKTRKAAPTAENNPLSITLTLGNGLMNIAYKTMIAI